MKSKQPLPPRQTENSANSVLSLAGWLICAIFIWMACMLAGGLASLLDRYIQSKDYVPYIGVWTAVLLFGYSGFASTLLLPRSEQTVAKLVMAVLIVAVGIMAQTFTSMR